MHACSVSLLQHRLSSKAQRYTRCYLTSWRVGELQLFYNVSRSCHMRIKKRPNEVDHGRRSVRSIYIIPCSSIQRENNRDVQCRKAWERILFASHGLYIRMSIIYVYTQSNEHGSASIPFGGWRPYVRPHRETQKLSNSKSAHNSQCN